MTDKEIITKVTHVDQDREVKKICKVVRTRLDEKISHIKAKKSLDI